MCGIAGIVTQSPRWAEHNPSYILKDLRHRGPDDEGWLLYTNPGVQHGRGPIPTLPYKVCLLFRRLAILDISQRGSQPMATPEGDLWIIFNGEIYNFLELRSELSARGYTFRSGTDTEVLLYGYHCWGEEILEKITGMFAFAFLDLRNQELFLARDFFGIKPLFYVLTEDGFAFSSEIPPLLKLPGIRRKANPYPIYAYLKTGLLDFSPHTFFSGITRLPPGHCLKLSLADSTLTPSLRRYFSLTINEPDSGISFTQATQKLREIFIENVRLHLRSDVPVGTALSGGIDSSAIVCTMRYLEPTQEIHTFSFVARGYEINEEKWVDLVSQHARVVPHKIIIHPDELCEDLDELVTIQGEPCGSTSIYAQFRVFRQVQEVGIKVILDGQGSDEMFAGYEYYWYDRMLSLLKSGDIAKTLKFLNAYPYNKTLSLPQQIWTLLRTLLPQPWIETLKSLLRGPLKVDRGVREQWFRERGIFYPSFPKGGRHNLLMLSLLLDTTQLSLPALLRYEDRNSMHFSIESRVPFLTPDLARFTFSLPEEYIINPQGVRKWVLREALRGIVPDPILNRRDKIGFATPEFSWWKHLSPWIEARLSSPVFKALPFFDPPRILEEWNSVLKGRSPFNWRIWRWLNLSRWFELFEVETE